MKMDNSDNTPPDKEFTELLPASPISIQDDLVIRPGQSDIGVKWSLLRFNKTNPDLAALVYRAKLIHYLNRYHMDVSWRDIITPLQQEVMDQGRQCSGRRKYAKEKGSPVRSYRRDLNQTDDERRAEDAARKRQSRAAQVLQPSMRKTDLSTMSVEEQASHRRQKARERKQKQREKDRLLARMTPEEAMQHECDIVEAEKAKLLEIIIALRNESETNT
ncbi:hypothetical protein E4191_05725 [Paracoccus liaowanqingii]|uniref:Uncharacterized protein n=1 Tax=Paracoccus liaowanqingii TaxID=2560053 RepID=A0A4P7HKU3_9RHOB|nr:hypothetical protein [Paracoccus liaowanqingii]QBX34270.1 hypothetical protein E4191_05725 [Paracoccus liaowanqingii]